jgi:hypothetical protein
LEFDWSPDDIQHRSDIREFLQQELPDNWEEMSQHGPGGDSQVAVQPLLLRPDGGKRLANATLAQ